MAGQGEVFGNDVEAADGGEDAVVYGAGVVVETAGCSGTDGDNLGEDVEVDARFHGHQQSFGGGDEVGVAEMLGHQLGDAALGAFADVEDVAAHGIEDGLVFVVGLAASGGHDGHVGRALADGGVHEVGALSLESGGDALDDVGGVGGHVEIGRAGGDSGQQAVFGVEGYLLHLVGAGQGCEYDFAGFCHFPSGVGPVGPALAEVGGGLATEVVDGEFVAGIEEAACHGVTHGARTDKSYSHGGLLGGWCVLDCGFRRNDGTRFGQRPLGVIRSSQLSASMNSAQRL